MKLNVLIAFVAFSSCGLICEKHRKQVIQYTINVDVNGTITSKFIDSSDRYQPRVIINGGQEYALNNIKVFNTLIVGDTLIKHFGSLKHYLIHKGDTIVFYPIKL
jgi:hypothetical protein